MKTAISLPETTFNQATRRAQELGISRSEFFNNAAVAYLKALEEEKLTDQINAALDLTSGDDSNALASAASRRVLADLDDQW